MERDWEQFCTSLPLKECRFVTFNFEVTAESDGVTRTKIILVVWSPSEPSVKCKMVNAMYVKGFTNILETWGGHIHCRIEAGNVGSLDQVDVADKIRSRMTVK